MGRLRAAVDFACVAAPKAMGGACLVVINIWLMKYLPPESYGIYALCIATLALLSEGLFGTAIDLGVLRLAPLYLEIDTSRAISIERAALGLKFQVIGSVSLLMCLGSVFLSQYLFERTGAAHLMVVVCGAALTTLLLASALLHLQLRNRFWLYGMLDAISIITKYSGIGFVLFLFRDSNSALPLVWILVWFAIGPAIAVGLFWLMADRRELRQSTRRQQSRAELLGYVKWFLATIFLSSLVAKLDVFLVAALATIDEAGIFAGGQTIASIPVLLGSYLAIVLNPKVIPYCRSGKFLALLRDVQSALFVACILVYAVIFFFREPIMDNLLPQQFEASASVILVLLAGTLAGMTSFPLAIAFLMFVRPRLLIQMECFFLPGALLAYLIIIPRYGAWGAAVVTAVSGLLKTVVAQWVAFRWARKTPAELGIASENAGET